MTKEATIQELYEDKKGALKEEQLLVLLNKNPPKEWVKKHPFVSNYYYLPIDKVEYLLKKIFKKYSIEVIEYKILFNTVSVHVRVHYKNITSNNGEMIYQDGLGAQELQTQKNSGVIKQDFSNINKGAATMALPIAKTLAIKDACDLIGNIFGANLNRKDIVNYSFDEKLIENTEEKKRALLFIEKAKNVEELNNLLEKLPTNIKDGELSKDIEEKRNELNTV
jgi:hypothetical protein